MEIEIIIIFISLLLLLLYSFIDSRSKNKWSYDNKHKFLITISFLLLIYTILIVLSNKSNNKKENHPIPTTLIPGFDDNNKKREEEEEEKRREDRIKRQDEERRREIKRQEEGNKIQDLQKRLETKINKTCNSDNYCIPKKPYYYGYNSVFGEDLHIYIKQDFFKDIRDLGYFELHQIRINNKMDKCYSIVYYTMKKVDGKWYMDYYDPLSSHTVISATKCDSQNMTNASVHVSGMWSKDSNETYETWKNNKTKDNFKIIPVNGKKFVYEYKLHKN